MAKKVKRKVKPTNCLALTPRADFSPASGTTAGRIAQIILNVDLRNSHDGLMDIAKKRGVDFDKMGPGQYLVFVNDQKNRFKIFAPSPSRRGAIILYYKSYQGRVDRDEIISVPAAFGVKKHIDINERLSNSLDESLAYKRVRVVKELNQ